ncbi:MAG: hypothetical protein KGD61_08940 [Candidatus Lokiarchaeota archaeon]|nr:hypothetical protein [Candidatus Lokiarchaeota archaeon]
MSVLSNNSPKQFGFYEARENAPDHITEILRVLEDLIRPFYVTVKFQGNSTTITIQDKNVCKQEEFLRIISLDISTKPKSYSMNLYHQTEGSKNQKRVYEIKVKGDYELKTLKTNLDKLIRGQKLTHHPRFYPF